MKRFYLKLPNYLKVIVIIIRERFYELKTYLIFRHQLKELVKTKKNTGDKINVLFYHVSGLSFGGTEKFLQIIAKHLNKDKYNVYFMYSPKARLSSGGVRLDGRMDYLKDSGVNLIEFDYENLSGEYPYIVSKMNPSVFSVLKDKKIDLLITAGSGYSEFPFNIIRHIPIILINVFASPNRQSNILKNICVSKDVGLKLMQLVDKEKVECIYIQSESPSEEYVTSGKELRESFGIRDSEFVFGRIGRPDDSIFDPIAINAFKKLASEHTDVHYIIMSPPPILIEMVSELNIKNVHFIKPSSVEKDVWSFHYSLDALAHFRLDGESFGLNIAESMIAGNPILTHKSHIWNSHLEYLNDRFSRVSEKDDVLNYYNNMCELVEKKKNGDIEKMRSEAKNVAKNLFLIDSSITKIEEIVSESVNT